VQTFLCSYNVRAFNDDHIEPLFTLMLLTLYCELWCIVWICEKLQNLAVCSTSQWLLNHTSMRQLFTLKWQNLCRDSDSVWGEFREKVQSFAIPSNNSKPCYAWLECRPKFSTKQWQKSVKCPHILSIDCRVQLFLLILYRTLHSSEGMWAHFTHFLPIFRWKFGLHSNHA